MAIGSIIRGCLVQKWAYANMPRRWRRSRTRLQLTAVPLATKPKHGQRLNMQSAYTRLATCVWQMETSLGIGVCASGRTRIRFVHPLKHACPLTFVWGRVYDIWTRAHIQHGRTRIVRAREKQEELGTISSDLRAVCADCDA